MLSSVVKKLKSEFEPMMEMIISSLRSLDETDDIREQLGVHQESLAFLRDLLKNEYMIDCNSSIICMLDEVCEEMSAYAMENVQGQMGIVDAIERKLLCFSERIDESVVISDDRLAVVSIMKDEGAYLEEFICYHLLVGVSHFYLYDNNSSDDTMDVLLPYIRAGKVTLLDCPGDCVQLPAYDDALKKYKYDTHYMAFIDVDEFIVPAEYGRKIPEVLDEIVMEHYDREIQLYHFGGIAINWVVYGTSGHKDKINGLVCENYLYRSDKSAACNHTVKLIVNPRVVDSFYRTPHTVKYISDEYMSISERGSYILGKVPFFRDASYCRLQINHYSSKSENEYYYKLCKKGWPDQEHKMVNCDDEGVLAKIREANSTWNQVRDEKMLAYCDDIKSMIKEYKK